MNNRLVLIAGFPLNNSRIHFADFLCSHHLPLRLKINSAREVKNYFTLMLIQHRNVKIATLSDAKIIHTGYDLHFDPEPITLNMRWSSSSTVEPGKRGRPEAIS